MKAGIHPNYQDATVVCACGNTFQTRSTRSTLRVDLCNVCHPFYTGEQRIVDTAGQVERFMKKVETASTQARPSKRQQRIGQKSARLEEDLAIASNGKRADEPRAARGNARVGQRVVNEAELLGVRTVFPAEPGRLHARSATHGIDLEARVLRRGQATRGARVVQGFLPRVLGEGRTRFLWWSY